MCLQLANQIGLFFSSRAVRRHVGFITTSSHAPIGLFHDSAPSSCPSCLLVGVLLPGSVFQEQAPSCVPASWRCPWRRRRHCLGPVHTNPFSNEKEAVLLRFQKDFRSHLSFSPAHTTTPYRFWKRFYTLSTHAQMNSSIRTAKFGAILDTHGRVVWRPVVSILMTSPLSHSIVFCVHIRKQRFQKASFSNRSPLESVFEWLHFRWSFSAL